MGHRKDLEMEERYLAYRYLKKGLGIRGIARELGRSPSCVSRELKRNRELEESTDFYFDKARAAQEAAESRRTAGAHKKMRLKSREIQRYVESKLKMYWTPEIISGRLKIELPGESISDEAIYQWILWERPELKEYLKVAGKSRTRRRCGKHRRLKPPSEPKQSIEDRPLEANNRSRIGDFEHDSIVSCRGGKSAIMNVIDRKSRRVFLSKVPDLTADEYSKILIERLSAVPTKHRHTTTSDNGSESTKFAYVDSILGTRSFFCHPHCSPERGTVENRNRAVRFFFPKGTNFDDIPDEYIRFVEDYLNNTPLKVLGFLTPNEAWELEMLREELFSESPHPKQPSHIQ